MYFNRGDREREREIESERERDLYFNRGTVRETEGYTKRDTCTLIEVAMRETREMYFIR